MDDVALRAKMNKVFDYMEYLHGGVGEQEAQETLGDLLLPFPAETVVETIAMLAKREDISYRFVALAIIGIAHTVRKLKEKVENLVLDSILKSMPETGVTYH